MAGSTARWFALYTTSRHEKRVAAQLQENLIEAFLPVYRTVHSWKNRTRATLELPLFPCYVFVRIAQNHRGTVLSVPGVVSIVGSRREAWPLPDFEIEKLRTGLGQLNAQPHRYLTTGDRARIRSGPLSGMEGVLVQKKNGLRVVLTIEAIMRSISIEVELSNLERIQDEAPCLLKDHAKPFLESVV
jgi:transcription antitermination factor NusG